jgi:NitT/TauT family transport system ATP-binding protein
MRITRAFHRFGPSQIIDIENVDLDWTGEATLFAPSGAGKTTLFRLLSGWYDSTPASHCVWDPQLNPYKEVRFVGGHRSLLPWKTVERNISLQFAGISEAAISDALEDLGLADGVSSRYPYELSLGMYKRVELLLAILAKPKILLLDEFYSSIGDEQKKQIRNFLAKHRSGLMTWITAHEEDLRDWIAGPQFTFTMNADVVTGIKRI